MRTTSFIHATAKGKDLIVLFALDVPGDPYDGESLTLQRTPVDEAFLTPEERGVLFHRNGEPKMLAEVRWGDRTVELLGRDGWRMEIDLRNAQKAAIDRAMAVLELMNFDGAVRISGGSAPLAKKQELLMEALESDKPHELRDSIRTAQSARELLTEPCLDLLGRLTPAIAEAGNVPSLAIYLLAAWREPRALEPLLRYFEEGGAEANEALGDVVVQDLPSILRSIVAGRFDLIRRLVENEAADEWVRAAAIETLVSAAIAGELPVEEVETYLRELMTTRLAREASYVWVQLAYSTCDLGSQQLLPPVEQAYEEGLVETDLIPLRGVREAVRGGRERAFAEFHKNRSAFLIDDVVAATSWWDLFSDRPSGLASASELDDIDSDDFADPDDEFLLPGDLYKPVQQIIRATPRPAATTPAPAAAERSTRSAAGGEGGGCVVRS